MWSLGTTSWVEQSLWYVIPRVFSFLWYCDPRDSCIYDSPVIWWSLEVVVYILRVDTSCDMVILWGHHVQVCECDKSCDNVIPLGTHVHSVSMASPVILWSLEIMYILWVRQVCDIVIPRGHHVHPVSMTSPVIFWSLGVMVYILWVWQALWKCDPFGYSCTFCEYDKSCDIVIPGDNVHPVYMTCPVILWSL